MEIIIQRKTTGKFDFVEYKYNKSVFFKMYFRKNISLSRINNIF